MRREGFEFARVGVAEDSGRGFSGSGYVSGGRRMRLLWVVVTGWIRQVLCSGWSARQPLAVESAKDMLYVNVQA